MRILHVCSEYPPQKVFGLGRYVSGLSRELGAQGHEVHVLTNSIGGTDRDVRDGAVHVHRVEFPPPPMPPTPAAPVMAFNVHLQQRATALGSEGLGRPEAVVSHDWLTALAGSRLAARFGVPHIWTVHDTVHGKRFGKIEGTEDKVSHSLELWAAREADLILVNSTAILEELCRVHGADREKMDLLYPGIDPESCRSRQSAERLAAFRNVLAEEGEILITFAGRLDLEKGVDTLINAFAKLRSRLPNVRLAIAGKGVLLPTIESHLAKLRLGGHVTLCGYLEGQVLRSFYSAADIHVCPSHYEPFGLVALEAMAAGAPVVVSDTGGLRDIVSTTKVGRRFPPRDPDNLADCLFELANSRKLRRQLGEAGKKHAHQQFGWVGLASRAAALYERATAARGAVSA